jgi:twinkle protein
MESDFIHHAPCDSCGSKDNVAVYSDGHSYCFGCGKHTSIHIGEQMETESVPSELITGDLSAISSRRLSLDTIKKFNYRVGKYNGKPVQIANYHDKQGNIKAQKLRYPDKSFQWLGSAKETELFGQSLFGSGKNVTVCEGEVDAMSMSQMLGNKWPVVSIKSGSKGAKRDIQANMEWLDKFETITFCFDQDVHGREAADECAKLFAPQKAKIMNFGLKDANEMLVEGKGEELVKAFWNAKPYTPDGIVSGVDIYDIVHKIDDTKSVPYPFENLNGRTRGMRKSELVTVTAGSGIGKSLFARQVAHHLLKQGETVGYVALEESMQRTALGIMGIEMQKPLHLSREGVTDEDFRNTFDATVGNGRFFLYNHFGSSMADNLLSKIRYLAKGCECGWIFLDHLSIIVSSIADGDERRLIDNTMTALRCLTEETGVGMMLVSHLRRPSGDEGFEAGKMTSLNSLRGSHAIAQLSDMVLGLERNQQDSENQHETTVRVLKNRHSGDCGEAGTLTYDTTKGILMESTYVQEF